MTLLRQVEIYLRTTGMAWSRFGRDVAGDPRLVWDMRNGRTPRPITEAKIRAFMAENPK